MGQSRDIDKENYRAPQKRMILGCVDLPPWIEGESSNVGAAFCWGSVLTNDIQDETGDGGGGAVEVDPTPVPSGVDGPNVVQDEAGRILLIFDDFIR